MVARMNFIATSESVSLGEGALDTIMTVAEGDMRKAVTFLQSAHQLAGDSPVSVALIEDLTSQVDILVPDCSISFSLLELKSLFCVFVSL
jgi:replication factor C subunit 2/4